MSELCPPLRDELLRDGMSEEQVQRVWAGIQRRRLQRSLRGPRKVLLFASLGVLTIATVLLWSRLGARDGTGPLLTSDGQLLAMLRAEQPTSLEFTDGSKVELGSNAEAEVVENNAHDWICVLRAGRMGFDIRPGGARRWTIEAGLATIEVVGTRFDLNRSKDALEIGVSRGAVLVRGERVRDRVARLVAHDRLVVREAPERAAAPAALASGHASRDDVVSQATQPSMDELLGQADAKRRSGDRAGAERILRRILLLHARDPRAALAAFTLGKLLFEARPVDAATAFAQCLALSPPDAIAEDALARLVESEARAGHTQRARAAAEEYRRRYPGGRWLGAMKAWAGDP